MEETQETHTQQIKTTSTIDNTQATDKTFKPKTDFFHSFFRKEKIIESLL